MKKYLFMLFALCAMAFTACSDDDGGDERSVPQLSPNNTDLMFSAAGGSQEVSVSNAAELNVVKINQKSGSASTASTETNVYVYNGTNPQQGKLKDPKYVTESGWLTVRVVADASGRYSRLVFTASKYAATDTQRDWYVHVSCGDNMYGIVFHVVQTPPAS